MKLIVALLGLGLIGGGTAVAIGLRSWGRQTNALVVPLTRGTAEIQPLDRTALPEPVRRYLRRAIPDGTGFIATAHLEQRGHFQMGEGPEGWKPFTATEVFRASSPGFLWDAAIAMAPATAVRVRDVYIDGEASMQAKILGLITVVDLSQRPELASGALARYLAESVWLPTRLAYGPGLSWQPVDDHSATAHLEDAGIAVELTFTFDGVGDPVEVRGLRAREVDGEFVITPWVGRFSEHRTVGGFRIPTYGEVAWIVDGTEVWYWKGHVTSATFDTLQVEAG